MARNSTPHFSLVQMNSNVIGGLLLGTAHITSHPTTLDSEWYGDISTVMNAMLHSKTRKKLKLPREFVLHSLL
jgi:hypothetical protein